MGLDNWPLLSRLRNAVFKKIKFLLNFNITISKLKLASAISASPSNRRLSFNDRPGLRACMDDDSETDDYSREERIQNFCSQQLRRTRSSPLAKDDGVDKKAEVFIANFYRQLQLERQISLEVRYARGHTSDGVSP